MCYLTTIQFDKRLKTEFIYSAENVEFFLRPVKKYFYSNRPANRLSWSQAYGIFIITADL